MAENKMSSSQPTTYSIGNARFKVNREFRGQKSAQNLIAEIITTHKSQRLN